MTVHCSVLALSMYIWSTAKLNVWEKWTLYCHCKCSAWANTTGQERTKMCKYEKGRDKILIFKQFGAYFKKPWESIENILTGYNLSNKIIALGPDSFNGCYVMWIF